MTADVAHAVCAVLWATEHIPVSAVVDDGGTIHVAGCGRELTTVEEVATLRAFCACSAHVIWHSFNPEAKVDHDRR